MSVVGDIYQVKQFSNTLGQVQEMLNVWYYRLANLGTGGSSDEYAEDLGQTLEDDVLVFWRDLVTTSIETTRLELLNLGNLSDFAEGLFGGLSHPLVGTRTPETMPLQVTLTFRLVRPRPGTRNGYKRVSGMAEGDINGSNITVGFQTQVDAFADELDQDLTSDNFGAVFEPVIAQRPILYGFNPFFQYPSGANFAGVGTQVSRKVPFSN